MLSCIHSHIQNRTALNPPRGFRLVVLSFPDRDYVAGLESVRAECARIQDICTACMAG